MGTDEAISICVASRGDPRRLRTFFESLRKVRLPRPTELVLVLNTQTPPDVTTVCEADREFQLVVLVEPIQGKGRSLNRAMRAARGDLLVFTDDDIVFDPEWLDRLWAATLQNPGISVFGGAVRSLGSVPGWIARSVNLQGILLSEHDWSASPARYAPGKYPFGPNMAVRRAAVLRSGAHWPEDIGPGTRLPVGDEAEFLAHLSPPAAGDRLFVADAVVHHRVEASYFSLPVALRRTFQDGWAAGCLNARHGGPGGAKRVLAQVAERLREIGSFRELACNISRSCGYAAGRYLSRSARLA